MRVIFFGTPDFAVPSLAALLESGEEVAAVVTQPDRVKGRGHKLSAPPVKEAALSAGIPVIQPSAIRSASFHDELSSLGPDVIAVVAYGRIIPPSILNLPPMGCVNVHGSLLPKYRGAAPIQRAVINGERKTGITTMLMNEGLDTGDILLQEETEISDHDDAFTLGLRLSRMGASLLVKTVRGLKDKTVVPAPQTGESSYAPPLRKEEGRIDWSMPAKNIFNLIRGTRPWPGAYCSLSGEGITIITSRVIADDSGCHAGMIEKADRDEFHICTGKGILAVLEVKPEGKKSMSAAAFINGRRLKKGMRFDSA
jgi:methionyl-tRNA formyltransferase